MRRLQTIVLATFFLIVTTLFFVFPERAKEIADLFADQNRSTRALMAMAAAAIDVTGGVFLYRLIRGYRYSADGLTIRGKDTNIQISMDSVRDNVTAQVSRIEDIFSAETSVQSANGRVNLVLDVVAKDTVDVREKTREIQREIRKVVEKQMGLRVGTRATIRFQLIHSKE